MKIEKSETLNHPTAEIQISYQAIHFFVNRIQITSSEATDQSIRKVWND